MNVMCNITQFVVVVPVPDENSVTLVKYFMQYVLLKFGICHPLILDDGSPFKDVFTAMCKSLNINYDVLAKRNHKSLLVEKFHRYIIMAITIEKRMIVEQMISLLQLLLLQDTHRIVRPLTKRISSIVFLQSVVNFAFPLILI